MISLSLVSLTTVKKGGTMRRTIRGLLVIFFVLVVLTGCNEKVDVPVPPNEESTGSSVYYTKSIHIKAGEIVTLDGSYSSTYISEFKAT